MNCDEAFEHLTDRYLHNSQAFQRHLAGCPRCQQMRETMAPALAHLNAGDAERSEREFSPSGADRTRTRISGGRHFLSVEAVEVAELAAQQLSARASHRRFSSQRIVTTAVRYAAVFVIGGIAAFGTIARDIDVPTRLNPVPSVLPGTCTRRDISKENLAHPAADPRNVILSCVSCHMSHPQQRPELEVFPKVNRDLEGNAALPLPAELQALTLLSDRTGRPVRGMCGLTSA